MRQKLVNLIRDQLKQGTTPQKMALTIALGLTLGVFPILGSTTILCLAFASIFKLNQPAMHFINYLLYPVQILLIPVFIEAGAWIFGAEALPFSVSKALAVFASDPALFFRQFGLCAVYGMGAWAVFALPLIAAVYFLVLPRLDRFYPEGGKS